MKRLIVSVATLLLVFVRLSAGDIQLAPPDKRGADSVPRVRAALKQLAGSGGTLHFAPGEYHFFPEHAFEKYQNVSNHESGLRRAAFPLVNCENIAIDGGGALFVMHGMIVPFLIDGSHRITVRNVRIDWAQPFHLEGKVVALDPAANEFELEVLPQCQAFIERGQFVFGAGEIPGPRGWRNSIKLNYWMDPDTHAAATLSPAVNLWNAKRKRLAEITAVGPHRFRFTNSTNEMPARGSLLISKGNPNRFAPGFILSHAKDVLLEDVTVFHASGMAVIGQRAEDVTLRRFRVTPSPQLQVSVSTIADATHFVSCRGLIRVEDCLFENMLDDAINVHAIYGIVEEQLDSNRIGVRLSHYQQLGFDLVQPGEILRFCIRETLVDYGERTVKSVERVNEEYFVIKFTESLQGFLKPESRVENVSWQANLLFSHNIVRHNRARSVLYSSRGKAVIENNTFDQSSIMAFLAEGDAYSWHEAGPVSDLTIRDNTFIGLNKKLPLIHISPRQPGETRIQPPYHQNITITGNRFKVVQPFILNINRVGNLRFEDNVIEPLYPDQPMPAGDSFHMRATQGLTIVRNTFKLPARATIVTEAGCTNINVSGNVGVDETLHEAK